ncbi:hypothetical protein DXG01_000287 [Tephrocybe rancida]|nr:hypothetical protein DXG01_000287 [Tephrocybe rancida]
MVTGSTLDGPSAFAASVGVAVGLNVELTIAVEEAVGDWGVELAVTGDEIADVDELREDVPVDATVEVEFNKSVLVVPCVAKTMADPVAVKTVYVSATIPVVEFAVASEVVEGIESFEKIFFSTRLDS